MDRGVKPLMVNNHQGLDPYSDIYQIGSINLWKFWSLVYFLLG